MTTETPKIYYKSGQVPKIYDVVETAQGDQGKVEELVLSQYGCYARVRIEGAYDGRNFHIIPIALSELTLVQRDF